MIDDRLPDVVPARSAYETDLRWSCHWSVSVSPWAADRSVTDPDSPDRDRAEVSSRPPSGRSPVLVWTGPLMVPDRYVGTARPLVRSGRDVGGLGVRVVRSGEVVRYDATS
ncbi:hypothetical protein GA0074694_2823 [Micromonospora inyonensis]|uniref:Uncharacterized protein n=1 Tax=Micromonospora inyonensis TaxID=47866 RepID=A0A1C6RRK5_9ACTN|nr:hypothetical protein GA0074694_2823 [Micromonospora inyonensis]